MSNPKLTIEYDGGAVRVTGEDADGFLVRHTGHRITIEIDEAKLYDKWLAQTAWRDRLPEHARRFGAASPKRIVNDPRRTFTADDEELRRGHGG